ncbi:MAG: gamma-glutamyltransferase [Bryobacteraceae bacterium]
MRFLTWSLMVCLAATGGAQTIPARDYGRSMTITRYGIAATSQILASQAGAEMLARGGSAADAAIAANAVLGLVEPMMDGIGGDLFSLYWDAKSGRLYGLNASGWTPKGMTLEYFAKKGVKSMPGSGIDSATVPGCVAGWAAIHKRFGKLPWKTLFEPAIQYATEGFPVTERIAASWGGETNLKRLRLKEGAPEIFLPNGEVPVQGQVFKNPALAKAYQLIAAQGASAFYRGDIAKAIIAAERELGGSMEASDLADWQPEWVEPISTTYRGWRVYELPPNGQGIGALEMLNLMEQGKLGDYPAMSAEALHWKIESMRIAYTDLRKYVSDPRFVKVPVTQMLSKEYAKQRAAGIDPERAQCKTVPGDMNLTGNTTYLAAVDSDGNIASWIQSVSGLWGSAVAVPGFGFHLHNRGGGFKLDPAHANAIAPHKRPFHTIIPGFAEKDGKRIGFGIMGGPVQPLSHAQFISNLVDHGMNLQGALEAPRFVEARASGGRKLEGCEVGMESRVPAEVRAALAQRGHKIDDMGAYNIMYTGTGQAVMHDSATHVNFAASDARGDGAAIPESPRMRK